MAQNSSDVKKVKAIMEAYSEFDRKIRALKQQQHLVALQLQQMVDAKKMNKLAEEFRK